MSLYITSQFVCLTCSYCSKLYIRTRTTQSHQGEAITDGQYNNITADMRNRPMDLAVFRGGLGKGSGFDKGSGKGKDDSQLALANTAHQPATDLYP